MAVALTEYAENSISIELYLYNGWHKLNLNKAV